MTRNEIMGMKPGIELDELIAKHIFGWQKGINEHGATGWQVTGRSNWKYILDDSWDGVWISFSTPDFSTDIKAAWEVVEKMRTTGKGLGCKACIEIHGTDDEEESYIVYICGHEAIGKIAPEAICKASLLAAMEAEGNDEEWPNGF